MTDVIRGAYWPSWRSNVDLIDTSLFTHAYFAFLSPKNDTYTIDVSSEASEQLFKFTRTLRSKGHPLKILLSIGGAEAGPKVFADMAKDAGSRNRFINSAIGVARQYEFDGLDLDWEFPSTDVDMTNNFGQLLNDWKQAIESEAIDTSRERLLLSAAVFRSVRTYDNVDYPFPAMVEPLDWINVMTYDYHGPWEAMDPTPVRTGAHTALFDPNSNLNTEYALGTWINAGMPKHKLVLGLALYGRIWYLNDVNQNWIGAGATIPDEKKSSTAQTMPFTDILEFNKAKGSTVVHDNTPDRASSHSAYAYAGKTWIGYDDNECIKRKVEYARELGIRGYFFWEIGQDNNSTLSPEAFNA